MCVMLRSCITLSSSSRPYRHLKLMVVGGTNIGKTSLLLNLVKKGKMKHFTEVEKGVNDLPLSTVGVELGNWEYSQGGKPKVTFMTWDFGGQVQIAIYMYPCAVHALHVPICGYLIRHVAAFNMLAPKKKTFSQPSAF